MTNILQSLSKTVHLSIGIAILLLVGLHFFGDGFVFDDEECDTGHNMDPCC